MVIKEFQDEHGDDVGQRLREFFDPDVAKAWEEGRAEKKRKKATPTAGGKKKAKLKDKSKSTINTDPNDEEAFDSVNCRIGIFERWVSY